MFSKIKLSITIIFISFLFYSCQKEVKSNNELESLVAEFDLKPMNVSNAPQGVTFKNFNTIEEAKEYLNEIKSNFMTKRRKIGKSESTRIKNIKSLSSFSTGATFSIFSPMSSCGPCSTGIVNAETSFDILSLSTMNINFDYKSNGAGGYNINNVNTYLTGLQFGAGWTQSGDIRNYSSSTYIMICIPGLVTSGISIGGVTFGWVSEHSYYVSFDPCGGGYDVVDGPDACN
jgi:hypothetical protein